LIRQAHILVLLGLLSTNGLADTPGNSKEHLFAQPPSDWQTVFKLNTPGSRIAEFIPAGANKNDWTTKITFESFIQPISVDPIELLLQEAEHYQEKCTSLQDFNLFSGMENGYPTSFRLFMCGTSNFSGTGEVIMLKAIQGNDYFYVLKLLKRVPAFESQQPEMSKGEIAEWATYFKQLVVCNHSEEHSCPKEKAS